MRLLPECRPTCTRKWEHAPRLLYVPIVGNFISFSSLWHFVYHHTQAHTVKLNVTKLNVIFGLVLLVKHISCKQERSESADLWQGRLITSIFPRFWIRRISNPMMFFCHQISAGSHHIPSTWRAQASTKADLDNCQNLITQSFYHPRPLHKFHHNLLITF